MSVSIVAVCAGAKFLLLRNIVFDSCDSAFYLSTMHVAMCVVDHVGHPVQPQQTPLSSEGAVSFGIGKSHTAASGKANASTIFRDRLEASLMVQ